jgi:hypothetical protein
LPTVIFSSTLFISLHGMEQLKLFNPDDYKPSRIKVFKRKVRNMLRV